MTSIGRPGAFGVFTDRVARLFDLSLEAAAAVLARAEDVTAFQPWFEGVRMMPVRPGPGFSTDCSSQTGAQRRTHQNCVAAIGRLTPGARFPRHAHVGDELTLVMQGGFRNDRDGVEVWRGEELYERAGTDHSFVVLDGEECVAAVLAVSGVTFG